MCNPETQIEMDILSIKVNITLEYMPEDHTDGKQHWFT